ncbi:MAG: CHAT domain-containing protein [Bryobacterales bacterium]|nr:CHAT domain-containing protein [Bryobacterales bacterium]
MSRVSRWTLLSASIAIAVIAAMQVTGALSPLRARWVMRGLSPGGGFRWPGIASLNDALPPDAAQQRAAAEALKLLDSGARQFTATPASLILRGRVLLLQGRFEEAIRTLRIAKNLAPENALPGVALGIAYGLRARAEDRAGDLGNALEEFLGGVRALPEEAHANAALICELIPAPHSAIMHWRAALDHANGEDRRAIEARIRSLETKIQRELRVKAMLSRPPSEQDPPGSEEVRLHVAIREGLAAGELDAAALRGLAEHLAGLRDDQMLRDLLKSPLPPAARKDLAAAAAANRTGDHEAALTRATRAQAEFTKAGNAAGVALARIEAGYALQRTDPGLRCMQILSGLREDATRRRWPWAANRAWFDELSCRTGLRNVNVVQERDEAARQIPRSGYLGLALRASASSTEPFRSHTAPGQAWQRALGSLRLFWESVLPPNLASNLYVPLALTCHITGKPLAAELFIRESMAVLEPLPNPRLKAQVLMELGIIQMERQQYAAAEGTFAEAGRIAAGKLDAQQIQSLQDVASAHAALQAGRKEESLARLQRLVARDRFPYLNFVYQDRLLLLPAMGEALAAVGDSANATRHFDRSVQEALERASKVSEADQRHALIKETAESWKGLLRLKAEALDKSGTLALWQTYRNAHRTRAPVATRDPSVAWLSYAHAGSQMIAWAQRDGRVSMHRMPAATVIGLADRFAALLSDPDSPQTEVRAMARSLYAALVGPLAGSLRGATSIVVDADGPLARIPWAALESGRGDVLADHHGIVQVHGWEEAQLGNRPVAQENALIVSEPAVGADLRTLLPPLPEARREAEELVRDLRGARHVSGSNATIDNVLQLAPQHRLFHFAGHGVAYGGFGALVLAGDASHPARLLTSREIAQANLRNVDLVLLSACSAGTGEFSGVLDVDGLVRAFLHAGAARVIAARWDVPSRTAATIVSSFYRGLRDGLAPSEALRRASHHVRRNPSTSHPYYWAAFQLYGAP